MEFKKGTEFKKRGKKRGVSQLHDSDDIFTTVLTKNNHNIRDIIRVFPLEDHSTAALGWSAVQNEGKCVTKGREIQCKAILDIFDPDRPKNNAQFTNTVWQYEAKIDPEISGENKGAIKWLSNDVNFHPFSRSQRAKIYELPVEFRMHFFNMLTLGDYNIRGCGVTMADVIKLADHQLLTKVVKIRNTEGEYGYCTYVRTVDGSAIKIAPLIDRYLHRIVSLPRSCVLR